MSPELVSLGRVWYQAAIEVRSVLATRERVRAESLCEELRAHGIKCDTWEPSLPRVNAPFTGSGADIRVVVAPEDEERAIDVVRAWRGGGSSSSPSS